MPIGNGIFGLSAYSGMGALFAARAITGLFAIAIHLCLSSVPEYFLDTTSTVIIS